MTEGWREGRKEVEGYPSLSSRRFGKKDDGEEDVEKRERGGVCRQKLQYCRKPLGGSVQWLIHQRNTMKKFFSINDSMIFPEIVQLGASPRNRKSSRSS